ncbi:hypothetical protein SDC9_192883 [bioreactor metagenome]|uniref:Uncharacterized protein n=1 Tax=bioreactor metagenome TaxID=1076179 RepID=A0A645I372_9ZZZZ
MHKKDRVMAELRLPATARGMAIIQQMLFQLPQVVIGLLQRGELIVELHTVALRPGGNKR